MSAITVAAVVDALVVLGMAGPPAPLVVDDETVAALLAVPPHEGLTALLGAAVDEGAVEVSEQSRLAITAAWTEVMARCVQLDVLLHSVSTQLSAAGIQHRALKGAAVACLDERSPAWRSYSDVDVLVPDGSLLAAARALVALQLRPLVAPVSDRWAERFAKSLTLVHPSGAQVDLHRLLAPGVFGLRVVQKSLFEGEVEFTLGDVSVKALDAPRRFLHACYHASLGGVRGPRHRRDVLLLAGSVRVDDIAARWGDGWSPVVVADALDGAIETGAALSEEWAAWRRSVSLDQADRAVLATYAGGFGDQAGAAVRAAPGVRTTLAYAWPLFWPSRAHLRSRGRSRGQHLRSVVRPRVLRLLRRPS